MSPDVDMRFRLDVVNVVNYVSAGCLIIKGRGVIGKLLLAVEIDSHPLYAALLLHGRRY